MLLYLGAEDVSVLDGGWRAWQNISSSRIDAGAETEFAPRDTISGDLSSRGRLTNPIETGSASQKEDGFYLRTDEDRRARLEHVQPVVSGKQTNKILIDTRGSREFNGLVYDYQPKLGHIPGAINLPYRNMLHANGRFISKDDYTNLLVKHSVDLDSLSELIWYCEVGVRAAMAALLHEWYFGTKMRVYDASFMEWSLVHPDLVAP